MDEHTLCQRIAHGSQRALEEAIRRYSAYVVTVIHNRSQGCLRPEDEEELASDVFFALWNHAGRIRGGSLRPWLGSVARNAAISRLRTISPAVPPLDEALLPVAGSPWEAWEQTLQVQALLDCLQPDDREIFTRYYDLCQTTAEIAEALRMPPSTVRTRLSRAGHCCGNYFAKGDDDRMHENDRFQEQWNVPPLSPPTAGKDFELDHEKDTITATAQPPKMGAAGAGSSRGAAAGWHSVGRPAPWGLFDLSRLFGDRAALLEPGITQYDPAPETVLEAQSPLEAAKITAEDYHFRLLDGVTLGGDLLYARMDVSR